MNEEIIVFWKFWAGVFLGIALGIVIGRVI